MTNEIRVGSGGGETKLTGMVSLMLTLLYSVLANAYHLNLKILISDWVGGRWYLGYRGYQEITRR